MKTGKIKVVVSEGLAGILLNLGVNKPPREIKDYLKKVTKKLSRKLKPQIKKNEIKGSTTKPGNAVVKKARKISKRPVTPRKKRK